MFLRRRAAAGLGALVLLVMSSCARDKNLPTQPPVSRRPPAQVSPNTPAMPQVPSFASMRDAGTTQPRSRWAKKNDARAIALTREQVCALDPSAKARGLASARPFTRTPGTCDQGAFCDTVDRAPAGADACFVANANIGRAERDAATTGTGHASSSRAWDGASPPKYWEKVASHLHPNEAESALLRKNGFVVLDRAGYDSYAVAFHDVFQQQLPVYVSADAILEAVFQSSQMLLSEVERAKLGPRLSSMLVRMHATLARSRGVYDDETIADLDLYLAVARALLRPDVEPTPNDHGRTLEIEGLKQRALVADSLEEVELFGRTRMVDWTQYSPRGHYASSDPNEPVRLGGKETTNLESYFRALTWLSRLEFNVVSRSCRSSQPGVAVDASETPREAKDAIALADLVTRAGAEADVRAFEDVYAIFAGKREDLSTTELASLARASGIGARDANAPMKLKAAIGDRWQRTARVHYMPEGASTLPVITTLIGTRITPDIAPLTRLVHDKLPNRFALGAADVAYVLGHDRGLAYMKPDLASFPNLRSALDASRAELRTETRQRKDVYGAWLGAVLHASDAPEGAVPSFMKTEAFADARMSTALAGYAQIRHAYVLLAGQGYDAYGCEIPDGFVEPAIGLYDALLGWSAAAKTALPHKAAFFRRFDAVLNMLRGIARTELSGAPLSEPQKRWLGMVSEFTPVGGYGGDSGEPPKYTGWYFDLFPDREIGAERGVDLVADYFTLTNANEVRYLGIEKAALGVFVVDVGGEPRAMVGPVVKPYERTSPIGARLDDEAARATPAPPAPWLASYVAPAPSEPPIGANVFVCDTDVRVVVASGSTIGDVSLTLVDHHGDTISEPATFSLDGGTRVASFAMSPAMALPARGARGIEGVHLHVHDLSVSGMGHGRFDFVSGSSVYGGSGLHGNAWVRSRRIEKGMILGAPIEEPNAP